MNKSKIGSVYIPKEDQKVWEESEILAKALGISRGKLVCLLLRKVINDPKTQVLISDITESISKGAREILHDLSDSLSTAERPSDPTDEHRIGIRCESKKLSA